MTEFFSAVLEHSFLRLAVLMTLLAGVACGIVGTYVVTRRITYIAGAVAHCVLGGMGVERYFQAIYGWEHTHPIIGATVAALIAAIIIGLVTLKAKQREDTVISAVWAIGMAVGVLFIAKTPGYQTDLQSYLFGNILLVSPAEITMVALLDAIVLTLVLLFYKQFQAVCFDEEFARLRGIHVEMYYLLLLAMTALAVVLLVYVVGIVMVIALLTLPAAIAAMFARKLWHTMTGAAILATLFSLGGLAISYEPDLPAGATTIVLAGVTYITVAILTSLSTRRHQPG